MSAWSVILEPTQEDATNFPLELVGTDATDAIFLLDLKLPPPEHASIRAESPDTEGDTAVHNRQKNRFPVAVVRVAGSTSAAFYAAVAQLERTLGKIHAEGGTMRVTPPDGAAVTFDLLDASPDASVGTDTQMWRSGVEITFEALPGARGDEYITSETVETTLPVVRKTIVDVPGDLRALARIVAREVTGADQLSFRWALRQRTYDAASTAALFYQAEALTPAGGSAIATRSGASGSGNNVMRHSALTTTHQSILSTQMLSAAHLSHVGSYRVMARVYDPNSANGKVQLKFQWSEGDFTIWNSNDEVEAPVVGNFSIVDLGLVYLRAAVSGTQQWQGRVLAKTDDAGLSDNDIDIDCLWFEPIDEGSGRLQVVQSVDTLTTFSARDEFNQAAGALTGESLPVGGTWTAVSGSDADDFQNVAGSKIERTSTSDTGTAFGLDSLGASGRGIYPSTPSLSLCLVQFDFKANQSAAADWLWHQGIFIRHNTANNDALVAYLELGIPSEEFLYVVKCVGGVETPLVWAPFSVGANTLYTLSIFADAAGRYQVWLGPQGTPLGVAILEGQDAALATGQALASGRIGIFDVNSQAAAVTRTYQNFRAWVPATDAAIFASQSLEVRHNVCQREDSGGTMWVPRPDYEGDYALIPPEGNEGRTVEIIGKTSRGNIDTDADSSIDDLGILVGITPRYRIVKEP